MLLCFDMTTTARNMITNTGQWQKWTHLDKIMVILLQGLVWPIIKRRIKHPRLNIIINVIESMMLAQRYRCCGNLQILLLFNELTLLRWNKRTFSRLKSSTFGLTDVPLQIVILMPIKCPILCQRQV